MYFEIASKNMNAISVALTVAALLFVTAEGWNTGDGGVKWLPNCDFPGSDIIQLRTTGEQCGRTCINYYYYKCNAFTHKDGVCYLKRIPASQSPSRCPSCSVCGFLPWQF